MAVINTSIRSRVAGISVKPLRQEIERAQGSWKVRALQVAGFASALLGGIGIGASFAIDRYKNTVVADKSKVVLADYYRDQIAAQLGIDPKRVNVSDLELAAKVNPMIASAIAKVNDERKNNNRAATAVAGGSLALGGMVPGLSGISHMAAHGAVAVAGGIASSLLDKDILHTHDVMEHINEKRVAKQPVMASDIVMLRISQNEALQKELKKANGTAFHKMNEVQQQAVIAGMPGMKDAQEFADRINAGMITEQQVLMAAPTQSSWMGKVGAGRGPAANDSSYAGRIMAERAAQVNGRGV